MAKGLGRGIDAIMPEGMDISTVMGGQRSRDILINDIKPNPDQPRRDISSPEIAELSRSISTHGVLQPLLVVVDGDGYMIIAGERRWHAAMKAELKTVPCIVRTADDLGQLQIALIENIQREDLSPLEQAYAIVRLREDFGQSYEDIAMSLGKAYTTVSNIARLVQLPTEMKQSLSDGAISEGHARSLLALSNHPKEQAKLHESIVSSGWSVRRAEEYARVVKSGDKEQAVKSEPRASKLIEDRWTKQLSREFGSRVHIKPTAKGGFIMIGFTDDEDLDRIKSKLT